MKTQKPTRPRTTALRAITAAALALLITIATTGCTSISDLIFPPATLAYDGMSPGGPAELRIGANYLGPIPRDVLTQRMKGIVRIEVTEDSLQSRGHDIAAWFDPLHYLDQRTRTSGTASPAFAWNPPFVATANGSPTRIIGTGFFVQEGGFIATNHHVIEMPGEILVKTWDGKLWPAVRLGSDAAFDLAIIRIDEAAAQPYPLLPLADSRTIGPGDYGLAVGFAFGFDLSWSQGIVAGTGRAAGLRNEDWMIQTDADINPGNSGGPLFNAAGDVIGINDAAYLWGSKAGFAEPADLLTAHLETMSLGYPPERARIGIATENIDYPKMLEQNLIAWNCVRINAIQPRPNNALTGLAPGDLILEADGIPTHTVRDLDHALLLKEPGQSIHLKILRHWQAPPPATPQTSPDPAVTTHIEILTIGIDVEVIPAPE